MAYPRKPSTSCEECRKRRTKCDKSRPSCRTCIRKKRPCGYRELEDFMFFDESERIIAKSKSSVIVSQRPPPTPVTATVLSQDLNELALNFFVSNYVGSDSTTSQFDFLPSLYSREGFASSGLQESIKAVGLAGYAKSTHRDDLIVTATKSYVSAIRKISDALANPHLAHRDSTLSSILLMGTYEVMLLPNTSGLSNLKKHLDGAISLANMRLGRQKRSETEMKMTRSLVQSVIMNSWIQNIPLPPGFHALQRQTMTQASPPTTHGKFLEHLVDLIDFRHAMNDQTYTTPNAVIYEAVRIDKRLATFLDDMPLDSCYQNVHAPGEDRELTYNESYHVYPSNIAAHIWNSIRASRLRLHRIIIMKSLELLASSSQSELASLAEQKANSESLVRHMARDICASVPQLAGYLEKLKSYTKYNIVRPNPESLEPTPHFLYDRGQLKQAPAFLLSPVQEKLYFASSHTSAAVSGPRRASLYNILYMLYALRPVSILPTDMLRWVEQRVQWIEGKVDADDLALLKAMLQNKPQHGPAWVAANLQPVVRESQGTT
ncbi:hypothetical protein EJ04DRAFT_575116 [Polyplosphaeria fusca]|uniref:Zn(2)-C6 fungal-type domain-containing protein n=1 Tax=Polyplosphaeria fusca TaxID=682080 RepID=A0A9P4V4X7_9PLEO|nr:hypothetical protein EJ04DRAFT_575116 [Polyplosphaeria fusca]